jgi:DNA polymerase III alpha subunit
LIERAKQSKLFSLSLTDTNGMYGLVQFYKAATEENIHPVLGVQVDEPTNKDVYAIFLAKDRNGYSDICKIITQRKLKEDFSLFPLLKEYWQNVFIITPSIDLLKLIPHYDNVFAELIVTASKKKETRRLYEFALEKKIKSIPSNPVYFLEKEDHLLHKVVTAIRNRTTLENLAKDETVDEEFYFKPPSELLRTWSRIPNALANLEFITSNCNVDLKLGEIKFPQFPLPPNETSFSLLWKLSFEGLEKRYSTINPKLIDRLKYELDVIDELGFADYFLVVWDIVREAKRRNLMMIGRGSSANSLVAYCLGFVNVDPIKYNLYFERFLNRGRSSPPDIDLDFSWRERDDIVKYVFDKYGYDRVAMISTTNTFRAKSAFRETAKVFGFSDAEISEINKFIPWTDARNLPNIAHKFPESKSLKLNEEPWKSIVDIASRLANFPRHLSIHASGIIIAPTSVTDYTALEFEQNKGLGLIITQPDMYPIEDLGLIKIDLLSQRSLGVLRDTMQQLKAEKEQATENKAKVFYLDKEIERV